MMDTLRNAGRVLNSAMLNSEMIYSLLMGLGWFFLMGWALALLVACASAFRKDRNQDLSGLLESRQAKLMNSSRF